MMTNDLNTSESSDKVLALIESGFNPDLPNLSYTAIPIKALMSRYYTAKGDYSKALSLLDESKADNPYLKFTESEKAEIYDILAVKDSFKYYSKQAFYGLPKNQRHWIQFSKAMASDNDTLGLDEGFELIKDETNTFFRLAYLSTNFSIGRDSDKVIQVALESKNIFNQDEEMRLTADYIIYGKVNVDSAIVLSKKAQQFFSSGIYDSSSKNYILASELNPGDHTHFENAGVSLLREQKYSESLKYLQYVKDSLNPKNGKSEYLMASIYEIQGKLKEACDLLDQAAEFNFPLAFQARVNACLGLKD
jgi:tetratricopeptide (TPR) repeat protein